MGGGSRGDSPTRGIQRDVEELVALDELSAPAATYPGWFHKRVVDIAVRDAMKPA